MPDGPSTIAKELYRPSILRRRAVPPVVGLRQRCVMVGWVGEGGGVKSPGRARGGAWERAGVRTGKIACSRKCCKFSYVGRCKF